MKKGIGFLMIIILLALPLLAQDQTYKVKVNRFYDYISVRDGDGNFLWNLKPEDFIVYVNGKEVEVDSLDPVKGLKADAVEWKEYQKAVEQGQEVSPPAPPKHLILVFDIYNLRKDSRYQCIKTAKALLESIPRTDKVSVYEFNGYLKMLTPVVVEGPDVAAKALNRLSASSMKGTEIPRSARTGQMQKEIVSEQKQFAFRKFLRAVRSLAESTAAQTIPKRFILFSDGPDTYIPQETLAQMYSDPDAMQDASDPTTGSEMGGGSNSVYGNMLTSVIGSDSRFGEAASMENYLAGTDAKFYTVRRGFNQNPNVLAVEKSRTLRVNPSGAGFAEESLDSDIHSKGHLMDLANLTGGKFYNTGIPQEKFINNLMDEVGSYYQIFFKVPEEIEKDAFNTIRIEVRNKDYKVNHKKGFFGKAIREELAKNKSKRLKKKVRNDGSVGDLAWHNKIYFIPEGDGGKALYFVKLEKNQLRQKADGTNEVEVTVISKDEHGQDLKRVRQIFSSKEKTGGWLLGQVPLTAKGGSVYISVRDRMTGKSSRVEKVLRARVSAETTLQLAEPIFTRESADGSFAEWQQKEKAEALSLPITGAPLPDGACNQGETVTAWLVLSGIKDLDDSLLDNLAVTFGSRSADGQEFMLLTEDEEVLINKEAAQVIYRTRLPLGYMPYGEGTIEIDITNLASGQSLITRVPFQIEDFQKDKVVKDEDKVIGI